MGDCEVCGAVKVGTRVANSGRSQIEACLKCIEKMGLEVSNTPARRPPAVGQRTQKKRTSGGYGGIGQKGKDIMLRNSKVLRSDYPSVIRSAREEKGWDQRQLAKRMAEKVNTIQHTEGGKRPTDAVIKKFERILQIRLMVERESEEETSVNRSSDRPLTMADLYEQAKKDLRGD
ncbi:MAG: helix-turn-helix domain-containing protein [Candidatus Thermoplasmatota archaeon]|nr:helix-turn-helix domain-containing protein [Candidatus Thermoplasmatota archaeon]